MNDGKAILVIGAGDATGGAIAQRFAREGYVACVTRRDGDKLQAARRRDPCRGRPGPWLRVRCSQGRGGRRTRRADRTRDRSDRGLRIQHRRQRSVHHPRRNGTQVFKIWEMGCFAGFLTSQAVARRMVERGGRHDPVHWRDGFVARLGQFRRLCRRQACAPSPGAEHGQGTGTEEYPRRARRDRRRHRHGVHPRQLPGKVRAQRQGRHPEPFPHRRGYWMLHGQPRDSWTFELDLRPWMEDW